MSPDSCGRGRPRDPSVDRAVLNAMLDLLEEDGLPAVSMEAVAARAGVSKASIYRRWSSKEDMIIDGIAGLIPTVEPPGDGDLRETLVAVLRQMRKFMEEMRAGAIFPWMAGELAAGTDIGRRYAEAVILPRRRLIIGFVAGAIERGDLRTDLEPEVAVDMLTGPFIFRKLMLAVEPIPDGWEEALVDGLIRGWEP